MCVTCSVPNILALTSRMAIWMARFNGCICKQETLLSLGKINIFFCFDFPMSRTHDKISELAEGLQALSYEDDSETTREKPRENRVRNPKPADKRDAKTSKHAVSSFPPLSTVLNFRFEDHIKSNHSGNIHTLHPIPSWLPSKASCRTKACLH